MLGGRVRGAARETSPGGRRPWLLAGLLAALLFPTTQAADTLQELQRVRSLVAQGDFDQALQVASRLVDSPYGDLFRDLPDQVLAEQDTRRGDAAAALELYRRVTPAGSCLVSHVPAYWNSCDRMAGLFAGVGDRAGRIDMLRRIAYGAGVRPDALPGDAYLSLAEAYEEFGDTGRAVDYYRTVVHTFDDRREQRRSLEGLRDAGVPAGDATDVILRNALSEDDLLRRAGRIGLDRLADASLAFDVLFAAAADRSLRERSLDSLVSLPLPDLRWRLGHLLQSGDDATAEIAQAALRRITGLTHPYLTADGELQGSFDDVSPFAGVWGPGFLVERLEDPYEGEKIRLMALDALGHSADLRGLEAVLSHAADPSPAWRAHALHALRGYGSAQVEQAVVEHLSDPEPLVRLFAAAGVARRHLPDAVDLLAEALTREEDPVIASAMIEALGSQGGPAANVLTELTSRLGAIPALHAAETLVRLDDDRGAELLASMSRSSSPVAGLARTALADVDVLRFEGESVTPWLDRIVPDRPVSRGATGLAPADAAPAEIFAAALRGMPPPEGRIAEMLESPRWSEYRGAAVALANSGVRTHLNAIRRRAREVSYATDGTERVQYDEELIEVLGVLRDDAAAPLLREALVSPRSRGGARAAAARSLARLGDADAAPLLLSAFLDPENPERVRRAAAWGLSQVAGPELVPLVLGQLESRDEDARRWTLLLLQNLDATQGLPIVAQVALHDPEPDVRALARQVSRSIDPSAD